MINLELVLVCWSCWDILSTSITKFRISWIWLQLYIYIYIYVVIEIQLNTNYYCVLCASSVCYLHFLNKCMCDRLYYTIMLLKKSTEPIRIVCLNNNNEDDPLKNCSLFLFHPLFYNGMLNSWIILLLLSSISPSKSFGSLSLNTILVNPWSLWMYFLNTSSTWLSIYVLWT